MNSPSNSNNAKTSTTLISGIGRIANIIETTLRKFYNSLENPNYELDLEQGLLNVGLDSFIVKLRNRGHSGTEDFIRKNGKFSIHISDEKYIPALERYLEKNNNFGANVTLYTGNKTNTDHIEKENKNGSLCVRILLDLNSRTYVWNDPECITTPDGNGRINRGYIK